MSSVSDKVKKLLEIPKIVQLSDEWFECRQKAITASSAANLLVNDHVTCDPYIKQFDLHGIFPKNNKCCNPYGSKKQFILDKCGQGSFKGNVATRWGQKYEDVAEKVYSKMFNKNVNEFGLLVHPEFEWLAASPDGITDDSVMLEIKCPFRRKITGIPPFYYWIQVQLQLEVADLDICDFFEVEFTEFKTLSEFLDDSILDSKLYAKGIAIQINNSGFPYNPEQVSYIYCPKDLIWLNPDKDGNCVCDNTEEMTKLQEWLNNEMDKLGEYTQPVFWKITDFCNTRIHRDSEWFLNAKTTLHKEWREILYYKKDSNYLKLMNNKKSFVKGSVETLQFEEKCIL